MDAAITVGARHASACLLLIYFRKTLGTVYLWAVVCDAMSLPGTQIACTTATNLTGSISNRIYNVSTTTNMVCFTPFAPPSANFSGSYDVNDVTKELVRYGYLSPLDFLWWPDIQVIASMSGSYTTDFGWNKPDGSKYVREGAFQVGGYNLRNSLFNVNYSNSDYCNVSVAAGQTTLTGTLVDFLFNTTAKLNVNCVLGRPSHM